MSLIMCPVTTQCCESDNRFCDDEDETETADSRWCMISLTAFFVLPSVATAFVSRSTTSKPAVAPFYRPSSSLLHATTAAPPLTTADGKKTSDDSLMVTDEISKENPLRVLIAGAGVGGLALANALSKHEHMNVTLLEQTSEFKRFGGPIQLASNAMQLIQEMDGELYKKVAAEFTVTGDKENGIKDGIRNTWYAKFDLKSPAKDRNMPYTGVIERPTLQELYLQSLPKGTIQNGDGVETYIKKDGINGVQVTLGSGKTMEGDVLIGADGIWSAVRATMRGGKPRRGEGSGATYSGYTVYAGELAYASPDNGQVGYKVYIGPGQYFVITDIGKGNYQWYAFLARPPGSSSSLEDKPDGTSPYLQGIFEGWSPEIHDILKATKENEIEQRDLYDRPPSVMEPWTDGPVALLGDGVHAMMPNLGQGGCQAIEDSYVLAQELTKAKKRSEIPEQLVHYQRRRLVRSASVQGLSRFASDIIIRGFDTPARIAFEDGTIKFENFNYAGIVTRMLQPILPIFFMVQFNFLYDGWRNEQEIDLKAAFGFATIGGIIALLMYGLVGEGFLAGLGLTELGLGLIGVEEVIDGGKEIKTAVDFGETEISQLKSLLETVVQQYPPSQ